MTDKIPETVWVVIDHGDMHENGQAVPRGVFESKEDANLRKDEIDGPFKSVTISRSDFERIK